MTGNDLKKVRMSLGESQGAFAARFGVKQATVSRWEQFGLPGTWAAKLMIKQILAEARQSAPRNKSREVRACG